MDGGLGNAAMPSLLVASWQLLLLLAGRCGSQRCCHLVPPVRALQVHRVSVCTDTLHSVFAPRRPTIAQLCICLFRFPPEFKKSFENDSQSSDNINFLKVQWSSRQLPTVRDLSAELRCTTEVLPPVDLPARPPPQLPDL